MKNVKIFLEEHTDIIQLTQEQFDFLKKCILYVSDALNIHQWRALTFPQSNNNILEIPMDKTPTLDEILSTDIDDCDVALVAKQELELPSVDYALELFDKLTYHDNFDEACVAVDIFDDGIAIIAHIRIVTRFIIPIARSSYKTLALAYPEYVSRNAYEVIGKLYEPEDIGFFGKFMVKIALGLV